jgi:hypothetical protein
MKTNQKKLIIIVLICLVIFLIVLFYKYYQQQTKSDALQTTSVASTPIIPNPKIENKTDIIPPDLKDAGVTDIFDANLGTDVKEDNVVSEPGHRFTVDINKPQERIQKGNAQGTVVVNDSTNKFDHLSKMVNVVTNYRFYTKYDVKHNWYTILEARINYSSLTGHGDQ